ncbi:28166_t:CDS:2, partial [Racocetra persica]
SAGGPLAGVWNFFNKGSSVKAHAKPVDLEKHLVLDCPNQNKDIIDFYTQIIANRQGRSQAAS